MGLSDKEWESDRSAHIKCKKWTFLNFNSSFLFNFVVYVHFFAFIPTTIALHLHSISIRSDFEWFEMNCGKWT